MMVDVNTGDKNYSNLLLNFDEPIPESGFSWQTINLKVVSSVILHLSTSKSEDVFGLSNLVIKTVGDIQISPLTY